MVPISLPGYPEVIDSRVLAAASEPEFISEFPFQRDMNIGNTVRCLVVHYLGHSLTGFHFDRLALDGPRAALAMEHEAAQPLPMLDRTTSIVRTCISCFTPMPQKLLKQRETTRPLHSMVLSLELVHLVSRRADFIYSFAHISPGQRWEVTARKEVIVSAGVFNTPQLLMLSGIGDAAELTSLGIPTRVNLPSVGKNMTDHVFLWNPWQVNNNDTIDSYLSAEHFSQNMQEWNETNPHKGPLSWTIAGNQMAWMRLPENDKIIRTYGDPSVGPTSAHFQIIWANGWAGAVAKAPGNWMTILTNLISPTSRRCHLLCSHTSLTPPDC